MDLQKKIIIEPVIMESNK